MNQGRILLLASSCLLAACQGNSESSSSNHSVRTLPPAGTLCSGRETITLSGIEVKFADFDKNGDGCLYPDEMKQAQDYAQQQKLARLEARTTKATGVNTDSESSTIKNASVVGNADTISGVGQIHYNLEQGRFFILADVSNAEYSRQQETLRLSFSSASVADQTRSTPAEAYEIKPPQTGNVSILVTCQYTAEFTVSCTNAAAYPSDNLDTSLIQAKTLQGDFNLNTALESAQIPASGYMIISYCRGEDLSSQSCFNNYAEVPLSFN